MDLSHTYSMRLVRPFLRLLREHPAIPEGLLDDLWGRDLDDRLPVAALHELLRGAEALTGDKYIGLRAACEIDPGEYGAMEYAASTAPDAQAALVVIGRYIHLVNDAASISFHRAGDRAEVRIDNAVPMPPAAEDFELAAIAVAMNHRVGNAFDFEHTISFVHATPEDLAPYREAFSPGASFAFGQPSTGFHFPAEHLGDPIPTADPMLHEVISKHAEYLLSQLPVAESFAQRVRVHLTGHLAGDAATLVGTAAALHVSPRTLSRRLTEEGTSFKDLHDDTRRLLALRYVGSAEIALSEVAFLLGFSQVSAFHRAFKRWTGQTPLSYRTQQSGGG